MRASQRYEVLVGRDGQACAYCDSSQDLTTDHVVPHSRAGQGVYGMTHTEVTSDDGNFVLACIPCNQDKADLLPHEFLSTRQKRQAFLNRTNGLHEKIRKHLEK